MHGSSKKYFDSATFNEDVWIESGAFDKDKVSLFSIFRDEIYFCQAFFDHYRSIGIEQFLILDDGSQDGTREFLASQLDCVMLGCKFPYGKKINWVRPDGKKIFDRAGKAQKCLIPHHFFQGRFAIYADADEFLLLPPNVPSVSELIKGIETAGFIAAPAQLVEVFLDKLTTSADCVPRPVTLAELFSFEWFYEPDILISIVGGKIKKLKRKRTKSQLLFDKYRIGTSFFAWLTKSKARLDREKVPFLKHGPLDFRVGSHDTTALLSPDIVLTMVHFVFTPHFFEKIERAIKLKSHSRGALKYQHYKILFERIRADGGSLLSCHSKRFSSVHDFVADGILKWPSSHHRQR